MVSVIFLILKILGLILLGILGLILLLILVVLLVPIRFEVRGSLREKKPEGRAVVSWLLHILSVCVAYDSDLDIAIRIFGFRLGAHDADQDGKTEKKKRRGKEKKPAKKENVRVSEMQEEVESAEQENEMQTAEQENEMQTAERVEEAETEEHKEKLETVEYEEAEAAERKNRSLFSFRRICDKLRSGLGRICRKFRAFWQRLLGLKEKKEQLQAFFQDEANRATIKLAKRQVFKLVKHVLPRKMSGRVRFGFEDPYTTGQILTYVSPFYGWYAGKVELIPVFEEAVLEGKLQFKGRVRIGTVLTIAGRMLLDKNFRKLLKKFRAA